VRRGEARLGLGGAIALGISALFAIAAPACSAPVVGGRCADGYDPCGMRCVPAGTCGGGALPDASDARDARDATDPSEVAPTDDADAIVDSTVVLPDTPISGDAADTGGGDATDTATCADGDVGTDASDPDAADGTADTDVDACPAPPFDSPSNCGACGVVCAGATPACKLVPPSAADAGADAGADASSDAAGPTYACAPFCDAPTTYCSGTCVDLSIDANSCGACGAFCPSGLCNGGKCRGARVGHYVTIGHDYTGVVPSAAVAQVVANAVFLPTTNPVKVLAFDGWADTTTNGAVDSVGKILGSGKSGRTWAPTRVGSEADLLANLNIDAFDVLLVYDQPNAPAGSLATLGDGLAAQILSFGQSGGVVVVLDGGGGRAEMPWFLRRSGVLDVTEERNATGLTLETLAFSDAVGLGVLSSYLAPARSVSFGLGVSLSKDLVSIIDDPASSRPVVLHTVVRKP
jgi:hypothetical protein